MREIKFRGKRFRDGKWIYGYLVGNLGIISKKSLFITPGPSHLVVEISPETVGQFTGLHDKNGKEIYEGDIVNMHYFSEGLSSNLGVFEEDNTITGDIQYRQDFATYVVNTKNQDFTISEYCQEPSEELEIIGNIFEDLET